jgi:hypothetical protein
MGLQNLQVGQTPPTQSFLRCEEPYELTLTQNNLLLDQDGRRFPENIGDKTIRIGEFLFQSLRFLESIDGNANLRSTYSLEYLLQDQPPPRTTLHDASAKHQG